MGVLVRGEVGDDFAIASGGFVLISTDNAGEDVLWQMYNVMRGRDYIHLGLLRSLRFYLGRYNIVGHTVQAILNTMEFFLRDLQADNHILGYAVNFRTEGNSPEQIRLGKLTVGFRAEEPPVLKHITIEFVPLSRGHRRDGCRPRHPTQSGDDLRIGVPDSGEWRAARINVLQTVGTTVSVRSP